MADGQARSSSARQKNRLHARTRLAAISARRQLYCQEVDPGEGDTCSASHERLHQETNVDVRPPLPRSVLLEAAIPRWKDQVFFLETVEVQYVDCRPLRLEQLRDCPLPCAYTVLHEWMMAAEPIPKKLLRKVLAHLLVVPLHCFSLFFDTDTRCATVVFEPDALTPSTCIEKIESPSLRCDTCDAWLDANHRRVIKPGDFGTEYFYEMQGLPHWIGIPGYVSVCCLCYHTAAYCRTRKGG